MPTLASRVTRRLSSRASTAEFGAAGMAKAIALSDRYADIKPQEYILPLTLLSGIPRSPYTSTNEHLRLQRNIS